MSFKRKKKKKEKEKKPTHKQNLKETGKNQNDPFHKTLDTHIIRQLEIEPEDSYLAVFTNYPLIFLDVKDYWSTYVPTKRAR